MSPEEIVVAAKDMDGKSNNLIEESEFMEYMKRMKRSFDLEKYTHRLFDQLISISSSGTVAKAQHLSKQQMEGFLFRL